MKKINLLSKAEMKSIKGGGLSCRAVCPMGDACCYFTWDSQAGCGCLSTMLEIPDTCGASSGDNFVCEI